ncbi:NPCBM/NEW2 domain-containing protein [Clostridium perfringens]|uniref:NPCBM/NEW2 domain-containing protein n=1 Tax=Clostridium perfringens TaxID=1502 RepID=UPI003A1005BE
MIKKKLSLLLSMVMTVSVLLTGFSNEVVAHAEVTKITETKQSDIDRVYLSDLQYTKASAYGTIKNDTNSIGEKIRLKVNGGYLTFNKGLFAHASSDVIYDIESQIAKGFDTFVAYVGIDASQGGKGNVKFIISTSKDNKIWTPIQTTGALTSSSNSIKIQQKLPDGTKYLRLQADTNGPNGNDHAVYGDAALVGDEYLNIDMPADMKPVETLDQDIMELSRSATEVAESYEHKLYQREFVNRVGYDILERIFRDEPQCEESISYLFENKKALAYFIETGVADSGDSYSTVLKNFDSIYKKYEDQIKDDDFLLKLAVTTSWAFAQNIYFWANHYDAQNVVERFEIYKDFVTVTDQEWSWKASEIEFFKNQSPAMLKYTLNSRQNNDEIKWFADYIKNVKGNSMNGYDYVEYKGVYPFTQPQYYGKENFAKWDAKYNLSKYNINTDDNNKVRWYAVMEIDGVCGAIAKTYTALQETFGRPSGVLNQPGHAASLICNENREWSIVNDVSGWTASRDEMGQMPLAWGMQSWNSNRSASYIVLTQNVLDNYEDYQMAIKLNILADVYKDNQVNREFILSKAIEAQPNNLDTMYNLIQAYKDNNSKTSTDYLKLSRQVIENFKYYPLPMADLLAQIQPNISKSELPLFDLIRTNALKDASVTTDADTKQPDIAKTMAKYLLKNNKVDTFSFSFSGDKANKLVVNDKYINTPFAIRYSIDCGETWIDTTEFPEIDLSSLANQINEENDILVNILGSNDIYKVDITKSPTPNNNTLAGNDLENTFFGNTANLQYRVDNDEWKDFKEGVKFEGDVKVEVRYKDNGTYRASNSTFYIFKEDSVSDTRKYIPISDIEVTGVSSYNGSQTKEKATDGIAGSSWHNTYSGESNKWITFKFNEPKTIHSFDINVDGGNGLLKTGTLYTSEDGEIWTKATTVTGKQSRNQTLTLDKPITTQYLKIEGTETFAAASKNINKFFAISEINFYEVVK